MANTLRFNGELVSIPLLGPESGAPVTTIPIDETVQLGNQLAPQYTLSDDNTVAVNLGGLTGVNVVFVKVIGSAVTLRMTSALGTTQAVPVDSVLLQISRSVPITALSITRAAGGVQTQVLLFLGQIA